MLLIVPALLALALALILGGSLRNLGTLPIRGRGAIVASFAIQIVIYFPVLSTSGLVRHGGPAIYISALALVVLGVARNWHLGLAARVALVGLALNVAVIVANGGHMPTNARAMRSVQGQAVVNMMAAHQEYSNTQLANSSTNLIVLSDILPVPFLFDHGNVFSIGDILIVAGGAILAFQGTRRPWRKSTVETEYAATVQHAVLSPEVA